MYFTWIIPKSFSPPPAPCQSVEKLSSTKPVTGAKKVGDCCSKCVLVTQSCLTLCNPMNYSPLGSSVQGILQARILEWVVIPFSRGASQTRDWTWASCVAGRFFTIWATREALEPYIHERYSCFMFLKHLYFFFIVHITDFNAHHHNSYAYTVGIQQIFFKWRRKKAKLQSYTIKR